MIKLECTFAKYNTRQVRSICVEQNTFSLALIAGFLVLILIMCRL